MDFQIVSELNNTKTYNGFDSLISGIVAILLFLAVLCRNLSIFSFTGWGNIVTSVIIFGILEILTFSMN